MDALTAIGRKLEYHGDVNIASRQLASKKVTPESLTKLTNFLGIDLHVYEYYRGKDYRQGTLLRSLEHQWNPQDTHPEYKLQQIGRAHV